MNVPLLTLTRVVQTDAVERDGAAIVPDTPHTFHVQIHPHQIVTLRLLDQPQ
jgi:hypothetical protein